MEEGRFKQKELRKFMGIKLILMRSVKERIANWESKTQMEGAIKPPISVQPHQPRRSVRQSQQRPPTIPHPVPQNMASMRQARTAIESIEIRNNNSYDRLTGPILTSDHQFGASTSNDLPSFYSPDESRRGNYQKKFLNIRDTTNMRDTINEPPPPRNTVNVEYSSQMIRGKDSQKRLQPGDEHTMGSVRFNSVHIATRTNPLKSEIDKDVENRTRMLIDALFSSFPSAPADLSYSHNTQADMTRMTGLARTNSNTQSKNANVLATELEPIYEERGGPKRQKKRHLQNFDDL